MKKVEWKEYNSNAFREEANTITVFGLPITTIYLNALIIAGVLTILYVLFSDILDVLTDGIPFVNPTLILAFITIFGAIGYLVEVGTNWNSVLILSIATIFSLIFVTILNVFVLVPVKSAEQSLAYTNESLIGRKGKVSMTIPKDGYGQVVIESKTGIITKAAISETNEEVEFKQAVIVTGVKRNTLIVATSEAVKKGE